MLNSNKKLKKKSARQNIIKISDETNPGKISRQDKKDKPNLAAKRDKRLLHSFPFPSFLEFYDHLDNAIDMTRKSGPDQDDDDPTTIAVAAGRGRGGGGTGMRVIVPLQGLVQGRGGLVLGSVIPCALFYFLQLYLKRNRGRPQSPRSPPPQGTGLTRTASRMNMSPRGSAVRARVADRVGGLLRDSGEEEDERAGSDDGVVDMGLVENTVRGFWMTSLWFVGASGIL